MLTNGGYSQRARFFRETSTFGPLLPSAGEPITVQISETTDTDDFRPWIRVWTPAGGLLGSSFGLSTAQIGPILAPVTGTYLVLVGSADSGVDGTGTYSLTRTSAP